MREIAVWLATEDDVDFKVGDFTLEDMYELFPEYGSVLLETSEGKIGQYFVTDYTTVVTQFDSTNVETHVVILLEEAAPVTARTPVLQCSNATCVPQVRKVT
jgi:hypothetical protein